MHMLILPVPHNSAKRLSDGEISPSDKKVHTRADSNRRSRLRRAVLYPLSYGCIKRLYEIALVILTQFFL